MRLGWIPVVRLRTHISLHLTVYVPPQGQIMASQLILEHLLPLRVPAALHRRQGLLLALVKLGAVGLA